jgi:hypothetical protein
VLTHVTDAKSVTKKRVAKNGGLKTKSTGALDMEVVAITGAGGMRSACARRLDPGRAVVLGDFDTRCLATTERALSEEGYTVITQHLDTPDAR